MEGCDHGKNAPTEILINLADSQAGAGRHKCAICAYAAGYEAGFEAARRAQSQG